MDNAWMFIPNPKKAKVAEKRAMSIKVKVDKVRVDIHTGRPKKKKHKK